MRADAVGQSLGARPAYEGADAAAARFDGAQGASPVATMARAGGAWIVGGAVKVAFIFQVEAGLVREIELIANPDVLATLNMVRGGGES
jgi:RNA polymerase sigma-70 factor, ECF subfamily